MKLHALALAVIVALVGAFAVTPAGATHAATVNTGNAISLTQSGTTTPGATLTGISGTLSNGTSFTNGILQITGFAVQQGQLVAQGTFNAVDASGNPIASTFTAPVTGASQAGACQILNLTLGPINLNLLGLVVQTNQIVVNVSAQPGPGNLLGNLLCAVTNALNNPAGNLASLNRLVNALNGLLATL